MNKYDPIFDSLETALFSSLFLGLTEYSIEKNMNIHRDMILQFSTSFVVDWLDKYYDMKVNYVVSPIVNGVIYSLLQTIIYDKSFFFSLMTSTLSMTTALVSINQLKK